jgi:two-component system NtrC family sensor kinase
MNSPHILVVADTTEAADYLVSRLLPQTGYVATLAEDFSVPPPCDVILCDVTRLRGDPLAGLKAQRRMGSQAPAMLMAHRITEEMAAEVFALGVREFVAKPIEDDLLLDKLAKFVNQVMQEREQSKVVESLERTKATLARRLDEMAVLSRIGRSVASLSDTETLLSRIVEAGVYLTRADEGAIFLLDEETGQLLLRAEQGLGTKQAQIIRQPSNDSDAMAVLQSGEPIMRGGEAEHKVRTGYLVRALINVPIVVGKKVIGVLAVYNHGTQSFEAADQTVLVSLADFAAIALDKVSSLARYERQITGALETAHKVKLHAETLFDPVDGIEAQVDTLLSGGFGLLTEQQHTAVSRIKQATTRLKEIVGFIREELREA